MDSDFEAPNSLSISRGKTADEGYGEWLLKENTAKSCPLMSKKE